MSYSIIKLGKNEIDLYPARTGFENLLKLGHAIGLAEYNGTMHSSIIPTDNEGLNELANIQEEVLRQIGRGIEGISSVLNFIEHKDLGEGTVIDLSNTIYFLSSIQNTLIDAGNILNATSNYLAKQSAGSINTK